MSSHFLFPLLLGSQCVYLFIFPFLAFLLFWTNTIYPVTFYFLCYLDHSKYTYLFPLSFPSCFSGWTLYIQSFSIASATRITVCLLIYFPFPLLPAVLDGHYMSSPFLSPLLLGSQSVYLFILPFLYSCYSGWTLYVQSFSISSTSQITVSLIIYFPFPLLPTVLDGYYISSHFRFPQLLGSQRVYLFIFPYLDFLLFWIDSI